MDQLYYYHQVLPLDEQRPMDLSGSYSSYEIKGAKENLSESDYKKMLDNTRVFAKALRKGRFLEKKHYGSQLVDILHTSLVMHLYKLFLK